MYGKIKNIRLTFKYWKMTSSTIFIKESLQNILQVRKFYLYKIMYWLKTFSGSKKKNNPAQKSIMFCK